jgi:hypothetical protein
MDCIIFSFFFSYFITLFNTASSAAPQISRIEPRKVSTFLKSANSWVYSANANPQHKCVSQQIANPQISTKCCTVPKIIDRVFAKTSPKRSFSMTEYERFGLVFTKTRVYQFRHSSVWKQLFLFCTNLIDGEKRRKSMFLRTYGSLTYKCQ